MNNDDKHTLPVQPSGKGEGSGITYQEKDDVTTITLPSNPQVGGSSQGISISLSSGGGGSVGNGNAAHIASCGGFPARFGEYEGQAAYASLSGHQAMTGAGNTGTLNHNAGVPITPAGTMLYGGSGSGSIGGLTGGIPMSISFAESDPNPKRVAIAYNPYAVDSLVGAGLALHLSGYESAVCVPYNPFGSVTTLSGYDEIMFVGVEVTQLDYTVLRTNSPDCMLNLICYRDSYVWLTDKMLANAATVVKCFKPSDEMFSELTARTDNTATKVVQFMLDAFQTPIPAFGRNDMLDLVARQVSQSYPIMPMIYDLGEGADGETELSNKARIHDLVPKLRMALASFSPREELADIELVPDVNAYLSHFRHVRYALSRSLHLRAFGRAGVNYALPVSPASELTHGDILHAALQNYDEVLTYEDVGEFRVWRIHSPKVYDRRAIAQVFKPLMLWSEGVVLCAVTNLTTYSN